MNDARNQLLWLTINFEHRSLLHGCFVVLFGSSARRGLLHGHPGYFRNKMSILVVYSSFQVSKFQSNRPVDVMSNCSFNNYLERFNQIPKIPYPTKFVFHYSTKLYSTTNL